MAARLSVVRGPRRNRDLGSAEDAPITSYTTKQGQYLAFIYYYTKIHGVPPAEADLQRYFRVSPPVIHQMIVTLTANGLIERTPGQPRSIKLRLSRAELPDLE
jgi:DNA-binding MarR family transcriptional regulator